MISQPSKGFKRQTIKIENRKKEKFLEKQILKPPFCKSKWENLKPRNQLINHKFRKLQNI